MPLFFGLYSTYFFEGLDEFNSTDILISMTQKEQIEYLSKDNAFGILTRQALELRLTRGVAKTTVYIIDLNDIHKLNLKLGYKEVNIGIRSILEEIKCYCYNEKTTVVMGRVFSGDEIAIVDYGNDKQFIEKIIPFFEKEEIGFKYFSAKITTGFDLPYYVSFFDECTEKLRVKKYCQIVG